MRDVRQQLAKLRIRRTRRSVPIGISNDLWSREPVDRKLTFRIKWIKEARRHFDEAFVRTIIAVVVAVAVVGIVGTVAAITVATAAAAAIPVRMSVSVQGRDDAVL
jgi:hypothetical protein